MIWGWIVRLWPSIGKRAGEVRSCSVQESGASEWDRWITQPQYMAEILESLWRVTGVSLHSKTEECGVPIHRQRRQQKTTPLNEKPGCVRMRASPSSTFCTTWTSSLLEDAAHILGGSPLSPETPLKTLPGLFYQFLGVSQSSQVANQD